MGTHHEDTILLLELDIVNVKNATFRIEIEKQERTERKEMALSNNEIRLVEAVVNNNLKNAKQYAHIVLCEDTTKKNERVVERLKNQLLTHPSVEIPSELKRILKKKGPEEFIESRYYVRDEDKKIIDTIIKMRAVSEKMKELSIPYKNTTLLYGNSGTGKTELSKYVAYQLNLPLYYVSFSSTIDSYMGATAKNLSKVFDFCKNSPCVLMLDEIDCVAAKRSSTRSNGTDGEVERTAISLMQELDEIPTDMVLIAATNRLDIVDDAIKRRFSNRKEIKDMSKEDLEGLTRKYIEGTNTGKYISDELILDMSETYHNPGQVMPELIKKIGEGIYREISE